MKEEKKYTETEKKILEVLNTLRPYLNSDGGDLEFVKYEDNIVFIKMTGACHGCAFSSETIKYGILESLKSEIPEIENVINMEL